MSEQQRFPADGLGLAVLRALLVPIIAFGEQLVDNARLSDAFWPLVMLAGAWAAGTLLAAGADRRPRWLKRAETGVDFVLLCALDLASGGPVSQVRKAFFVLPLLGAVTLRPRHTALWGALAVGGYMIVSLAHPGAGDAGGPSAIPVTALYLGWTGVAATLLAWKLARQRTRIEQLAAHRHRLVAQAIAAEEHARKQLAYALHDEPVQTLAGARLILSAHPARDDPQLVRVDQALATTLEHLREIIFDLRPLVIEHEGVIAALEEIAEHHSTRTGAAISIRIDPSAPGAHDEVVLSLGRELLTNAAHHAHANKIVLTLTKQSTTLTLTVTDNGKGIPDGREQQALHDGHVGLASARERAEALGGTLNIDTLPGRGTTLTATLPTRRDDDRTPLTATDPSPSPADPMLAAPRAS